jgi:hypothetical protein
MPIKRLLGATAAFLGQRQTHPEGNRGQEVDETSPFEIADDTAVTLTALPRPVVDADDVQGRAVAAGVPADNPQQGIFAHRQHQPPRQTRGRASTQSHAEMMNDCVEPERASGRFAGHRLVQPPRSFAATPAEPNQTQRAKSDISR